jgi:hypothetical protein
MHRAITLWRARLKLAMFALLQYRPMAGAEEPDPAKPDPAKPDPAKPDPAKPDPERKPPWGDDKDFDAQKAWTLLENVREDARKAKAEREELAKKVKTHEDASKSDQEKLSERVTEAEKRATSAEGTALRLEVALEKAPEGMPLAQVRKLAKRLSGSTKEELEADADELFEDFKTEDEPGQAPRSRPKERLRPGAAPSAEPEETDPIKLAAQVPRMY